MLDLHTLLPYVIQVQFAAADLNCTIKHNAALSRLRQEAGAIHQHADCIHVDASRALAVLLPAVLLLLLLLLAGALVSRG
jgi:hypothetical protein